jgi:NADPH:quinone reductase-like Zn-dependent oxidoreductase
MISHEGDHLLIRGGTTSVGLAAASIAKHHDCTVSSTSRQASRADLLKSSGADHVFIDSGSIAKDVRAKFPNGVNKVLELVGTTSLGDSLQCLAEVRGRSRQQ